MNATDGMMGEYSGGSFEKMISQLLIDITNYRKNKLYSAVLWLNKKSLPIREISSFIVFGYMVIG